MMLIKKEKNNLVTDRCTYTYFNVVSVNYAV